MEWNRTFLPRDCKQITTEFKFCLSQRSTVWKVSCGGTPNDFAASRKAFIFSIHLKASDVLLTFFTEPCFMSFTSLAEKQNAISKNIVIFSFYFRRFFKPIFRFLQIPAKQDPIFQSLVKVVHIPVSIYVFAGNCLNPFQTFLCEFLTVLAIDL